MFTATEAAILWLSVLAIGFIAFLGGLLGAFVGIWIRPFIAATDIQIVKDEVPLSILPSEARKRRTASKL